VVLVRRELSGGAACALAATALIAGCGSTRTTADHKLLVAGATAITDSGCEACHMIGADGNPGPGPSLTTIGARRSVAQITRALDTPTQPMPSFRFLAPREFTAIVAYLASLKSRQDLITLAGSSALNPKPVPLGRTVICKQRKTFWANVIVGSNAEGSKETPKARAQIKRALHALCDIPAAKAHSGR
jgi:mono/diheme cytochrome c family protein